MTIDLVGYTGFVGSNLALSYTFDHLYNSKNIESAYGTCPDVLIYAGVTGTKYIANKFPEKDWAIIECAKKNIEKIAPKKLVLISTIDVYLRPDDLNESDSPTSPESFTYGHHRLLLEEWVKDNIEDYLIVRLPGIYGENLKKNYIYDLINPIPQALTETKFDELVKKESDLNCFYEIGADGYYHPKLDVYSKNESLKNIFYRLEFSALNFTDTRGVFQYYNLKWLWNHIVLAMKENLQLVNISTEPFSIAELYKKITNKTFVNELNNTIPYYNYKTIHCGILGGKDGYLLSKEDVMSDIELFVKARR